MLLINAENGENNEGISLESEWVLSFFQLLQYHPFQPPLLKVDLVTRTWTITNVISYPVDNSYHSSPVYAIKLTCSGHRVTDSYGSHSSTLIHVFCGYVRLRQPPSLIFLDLTELTDSWWPLPMQVGTQTFDQPLALAMDLAGKTIETLNGPAEGSLTSRLPSSTM